MNSSKKYFATGEFAKLCDISKQTLIYYDNIGIFKPAYKDENNFRFYALSQYDTICTLITLRDVGMSLEDIRSYLDKRTPQKAVDMLTNEYKKIEKKIQELDDISRNIKNKIDVINKGIKIGLNNAIYIKEMETESLILNRFRCNSETDIIFNAMELIKYCNENKIYSGYSLGATVSKENIINKRYTKISSLFIKVDKSIKSEKITIKPKGLYACINHIGSYETTFKSYDRLLKYIEENGYDVDGDSYEWTLFDSLIVKSEDEYLTEINIPIRKAI
ncbi:effector-binding domain-containing protein [Clostridium cavendishii DSM 21758]|uniref:Effector-binding domain-containing protein n=1 Tax=Clostridium cavendishii DSM 21758 TaxID=1121302 RepID=A0A1M6DD88_9CLOT|nr:MerR family transcriptional regulator [Clostridium cavendishii]SHI70968.1 effector-binding domain-containing protein [Clostridium cavendishii DSM 21758]